MTPTMPPPTLAAATAEHAAETAQPTEPAAALPGRADPRSGSKVPSVESWSSRSRPSRHSVRAHAVRPARRVTPAAVRRRRSVRGTGGRVVEQARARERVGGGGGGGSGTPKRLTPRQPTAQAPTSGPLSPRRTGVIRAPRTKFSRLCSSISCWAALKNVAPKPSATEPPTTARSRSSRLQTEATAMPDHPAGAHHDVVARLGRRATGDLGDRRAAGLGLEAAPGATGAAPTVRLDDHVTDVAGVAGRTVEQLAVEHDAAADAGRHDHRQEVGVALRRAEPPLGEGQRLGVEVAVHVDSRSPRQPLAQRERAATTAMLSGDTALHVGPTGPAQPTPTATGATSWRSAPAPSARCDGLGEGAEQRLGRRAS